MPLIQAEGISKRYANHTALEDFSLSIPESSIFGLLGPNGAGKTTFIRILNQITGPDTGYILFQGEKLERKHTAYIGYLPEERGLYKKMKVGEQAMYLARLKGLSKKEAREKLDFWFTKFELKSWTNKRVEELSKGMQQKIQFICTVLHEPKLLIFDEPFSGFDPVNAEFIKNEILDLRKKGATIVFSTHRMESVETLCDHIALIHKSRKVLDGPLREIKLQFRKFRFEIIAQGDAGKMREILEKNGTVHAQEKYSSEETKWVFSVADGFSAQHVIRSIPEEIEVRHFNEIIPTANDIFIQTVTGKNHA